ncbi:MAG: transporter [Crocinitomicaceae bacterium]|jgi:hypothetical protein|nr:transporter [Crocinitomicaceae bacterium]MDP4760186.1 transporter [Crocinitomicaceae bacterium]
MNLIKQFLPIFLFVFFFSENSNGQSLPSIQLDRPDQTECPFITPKKYIQVENGFTTERLNNQVETLNYPTSLWKYGVNEKFELRFITEIATMKSSNKQIIGFSPLTFGFKVSLFEEKGMIPKTSFIGHVTSAKLGSKEFHTDYIAPAFRFTMQHTLSDHVSLAYNLGIEWYGENAGQTYIYTLTNGYSLTNKLGGYLEVYGFLPAQSPADHRVDGGITYLVNKDFILDFSAGFGLVNSLLKNYFSLGVSYRFNTASRK